MDDRCRKVKELLDDMATSTSNKKLFKKFNFALSDFRLSELCLKDLIKMGQTDCFSEDVMKMFQSFGFSVKEKGIGWIIA